MDEWLKKYTFMSMFMTKGKTIKKGNDIFKGRNKSWLANNCRNKLESQTSTLIWGTVKCQWKIMIHLFPPSGKKEERKRRRERVRGGRNKEFIRIEKGCKILKVTQVEI